MFSARNYVAKKMADSLESFKRFKHEELNADFSLSSLYYGFYSSATMIGGFRAAYTALWYQDYQTQLKPIGVIATACSGLRRDKEFGEMHIGKHIVSVLRVAPRDTLVFCDGDEIGHIYYSKKSSFFLLGSVSFEINNNAEAVGFRKSKFYPQANAFTGGSKGVFDIEGNIKWKSQPEDTFLISSRTVLQHAVSYTDILGWNPFSVSPDDLESTTPLLISSFVDGLSLKEKLFMVFLCCHARMFASSTIFDRTHNSFTLEISGN